MEGKRGHDTMMAANLLDQLSPIGSEQPGVGNKMNKRLL